MGKRYLIAGILLLSITCSAQKKTGPLFRNGDRVCFIGNSITNNGRFYNYIYLYYATRFPQEKITFYNCGISGDVTGGVLKRLDSDILVHAPTWSVLMTGMNDVKRNLYTTGAAGEDVMTKREAALNTYRENSDQLVKQLTSRSKVILEEPTIFDQTGALKSENAVGVNDALGLVARQVRQLAGKYHTLLVDYRTIMNRINKNVQEKDSTATIIGADRVHPGPAGHMLMAYQFLISTGATEYVSKMAINARKKQPDGSINCTIKMQAASRDSLRFSCLEYSLPFPVDEEAESVLSWVPFTTALNKEILQVRGLAKGSYRLKIDTVTVGTYSARDLKEGINLAIIKSTPQYQHALRVMELCMLYRKTEALLRNLKFVETGHLHEIGDTKDTAAIRQFLDARLDKYRNSGHLGYYQTQFAGYLTNKPKEAVTKKKLRKIEEMIYRSNQPEEHTFLLSRTD